MTGNVLNYMPNSVQAKAKSDIHKIWMAETRKNAHKAFDAFLEKHQAKYEAPCQCLAEDRDVLGRILVMAGRLAREQGSTDGFRTVVNTGRVGRQDVYHLHVHILGGDKPLPGMIQKSK